MQLGNLGVVETCSRDNMPSLNVGLDVIILIYCFDAGIALEYSLLVFYKCRQLFFPVMTLKYIKAHQRTHTALNIKVYAHTAIRQAKYNQP